MHQQKVRREHTQLLKCCLDIPSGLHFGTGVQNTLFASGAKPWIQKLRAGTKAASWWVILVGCALVQCGPRGLQNIPAYVVADRAAGVRIRRR